MAASSSKQSHNVLLTAKTTNSAKPPKKSRKGKGKEQSLPDPTNGSNSAGGEGPTSWNWVSLTDSSASKYPPIFTKDGSYFFSLVGPSIKVYSTVTGQIVSTLTAPCPEGKESRSQLLTCAVLSPQNAFQLITGSLNGCIAVWDFIDASLLRVVDIEKPVHHLCAHESLKNCVFVTATKLSLKTGRIDDSALVLRVSLNCDPTSTQLVQKAIDVTSVGKVRAPAGLSFSPNGEWLVVIAGHTSYVASTSAQQPGFTKYVSPDRLTCLAFHPFGEYFATGDERGCIRLWYCLTNRQPADATGVEKKSQTTSLHWHAHAVSSIAFTSNGAYLLSGGEESVLVIWQLHTRRKEFVPRVGAPINTIAVLRADNHPEEYLLGLVDASYAFVNATNLKISRVFSRIKLEPVTTQRISSRPRTAPLSVHLPTATIILPSSHPSSLQFFSPSSSKLISEVEVSPSNRVSRRDETPPEPYKVEYVAVSSSGDWMGTVDSRAADNSFKCDAYLKFWKWDRQSGFWILNTRVDRPHGSSPINSVSFRPTGNDNVGLQLATTGTDGNVKIWRLRATRNSEGPLEESWVTRSATRYRDSIPTHAAWAHDGSLLAVSFGPHVALYDPSTTALLRNLVSPQCKTVLSSNFLGKTGRYLVTLSATAITLWDLIYQTVQWRFTSSSQLSFVVPHPTQDSFALISTPVVAGEHVESCVRIFRAASPKPTFTTNAPHAFRTIAWYPLNPVSSTSSSFKLIGITGTWTVIVMGNGVQPSDGQPSSSGRGLFGKLAPAKRTLFEDIFGKSVFQEARVHHPPTSDPQTSSRKSALTDEPAYLLSSFDTVFDHFVDTVTRPRAALPISPTYPLNIEAADNFNIVPSAARPKTIRVVDEAEMLFLGRLFKQQTLSQTRPHLSSNGHSSHHTNGKTNGTRQPSHPPLSPRQNDTLITHKSPKPGVLTTIPSTALLPPSSPVASSRKRKKSLG